MEIFWSWWFSTQILFKKKMDHVSSYSIKNVVQRGMESFIIQNQDKDDQTFENKNSYFKINLKKL